MKDYTIRYFDADDREAMREGNHEANGRTCVACGANLNFAKVAEIVNVEELGYCCDMPCADMAIIDAN